MDEFYIKGIYPFTEQFQQDAKTRVIADGGTFENETSILEKASAIWRPNGTKDGKLYALRPSNGNGDFTVTRNTTATETDKDGVSQTVLANVPRIDWSLGYPVVLLEPQRTNSVRNSTMAGAVAGTPGAQPTNWSTGINAGLTRTIVGTGFENGFPYVDIKFSGTATSGQIDIATDTAAAAATTGQTWSSSMYLRLVSGSIAGSRLQVWSFSSAMSYLGTFLSSITLTPTLQRFILTGTTSNASTAFVGQILSIILTTGQSYDFTVRLAAPQLELGAYATSFIPTFGSAVVTRNVDVITRGNIYTNNLITSAGGTWFVDLRGNVPRLRDAASFGLCLDAGSGLSNGFALRLGSASTRIQIWKAIALAGSNLFTTTANTAKIAIKWDGSTADIFENGIKVVSATPFTPTAMENLNGTPSDVPKFINEMALFTTPLTDAECIQLTGQ